MIKKSFLAFILCCFSQTQVCFSLDKPNHPEKHAILTAALNGPYAFDIAALASWEVLS